jgi:hypothetical protein
MGISQQYSMKVIEDFYCIKTGVKYKKGDSYKGTRKDIKHLLETVKKVNKKK